MKTALTNASLLISFSLVSLFAQASPQISDLKYQGNDLHVMGTGFGTFDGSILSWDDFERHDAGTSISNLTPITGHTWTMISEKSGNRGITIDNEHVISGKNAVKVDWSDGLAAIRAFGWAGKGPYDQLYISYWRWMEGNYLPSLMNHKQFYVYGNGTASELPQLILMIPAGQKCWGANGNYDAYTLWNLSSKLANNMATPSTCWEDTSYKFNRWEVFVKLNTPKTVSNGILEVLMDNRKIINNQAYPARNVDGSFKDFRLGHMAEGFSATAKAWFDDVYIATTRARVEVCESDIYENCRIKHIQYVKPSDWSDTSILVDLRNLDEFKGEKSYLYVIDHNGEISGQGQEVPAPMSPTQ